MFDIKSPTTDCCIVYGAPLALTFLLAQRYSVPNMHCSDAGIRPLRRQGSRIDHPTSRTLALVEPCRDQISKDFRAGTHQPLHPLRHCHQVMRLHAFIRPVDLWGAPLCEDFGAQPYSLQEFSRAEYFGVDGLEPHTRTTSNRILE